MCRFVVFFPRYDVLRVLCVVCVVSRTGNFEAEEGSNFFVLILCFTIEKETQRVKRETLI